MARKQTKKRPGRPAGPVERVPMSFRVTPDTKSRLEELAKQSGRSISQEAELRLERSFEREEALYEALSAVYDARLAGVVLAVAETIKMMGPLTRYSVQYTEKGPVLEIASWDSNKLTRQDAFKAARKLLEILAQPGIACEFDGHENIEQAIHDMASENGVGAVMLALRGIRGEVSPEVEGRWKKIRELLGPLATEVRDVARG